MSVIAIVFWVVQLLITMKALSRLGFSPAWAALGLFPLAGLIGLWVLAFVRWPIRDAKEIAAQGGDGLADTFA